MVVLRAARRCAFFVGLMLRMPEAVVEVVIREAAEAPEVELATL